MWANMLAAVVLAIVPFTTPKLLAVWMSPDAAWEITLTWISPIAAVLVLISVASGVHDWLAIRWLDRHDAWPNHRR
jgi:membrane protein implicated in regulation of membrane protease activity